MRDIFIYYVIDSYVSDINRRECHVSDSHARDSHVSDNHVVMVKLEREMLVKDL